MVWLQYMMVKKFEDMITRCDIIHERDRQQDGRTDRHRTTAKVALMHRIATQISAFSTNILLHRVL